MKTRIISAFPGCGKTTAFLHLNKTEISVLDSDSSKFDKSDFPNNYIEHIKENIGKVDIIFVSSHQTVRDALTLNGIDYALYYPSIERKNEFMMLYSQRGNDERFIKMLSDNFEGFIENIENNDKHNKICLNEEGSFILNHNSFKRMIKEIESDGVK